MSRTDRAGKRRAREAALQMLYHWEIGRCGAHEAIATYWPAHDPAGEVGEDLRTFANGLVHGVVERVAELDQLCLLYTSPSPRDRQKSRMPSSA